MNKILISRYRRCFEFPASYGRLFGEGSVVLSRSNHRFIDLTFQDAINLQNIMRFAEAEARALGVKQATGKSVITLGPRGLWQVIV